jgi:prepilin peptidase CpaA
MNLITTAPFWLIFWIGCAAAAAMIDDAMRFRISNPIPIAIILGAVVAAFVEGPSLALWQNAVVFAAILAIGTGAFAAGLLGGGDVKTFAALGLWFDLRSGLWFVAMVLICGGLLALAVILMRLVTGRGLHAGRKARLPYGVAIGLGAFAMIALDSGLLVHHPRPLPPIRIAPHRS